MWSILLYKVNIFINSMKCVTACMLHVLKCRSRYCQRHVDLGVLWSFNCTSYRHVWYCVSKKFAPNLKITWLYVIHWERIGLTSYGKIWRELVWPEKRGSSLQQRKLALKCGPVYLRHGLNQNKTKNQVFNPTRWKDRVSFTYRRILIRSLVATAIYVATTQISFTFVQFRDSSTTELCKIALGLQY